MDFVYNLFIKPLEFIIDILFVWMYDIFQEPAACVIFLSIIVNFLALPLYRSADRIQKAQQLKQIQMQPVIDHIKSVFKGDEQYMMLSAYYRIENYHPLSVLKESFPLLLQIPIFIAAYRYLSSASILKGAGFGVITDLGAPDRLLKLGGRYINILPFLMTALNLLSGFVYSRKKTLRQKLQIIGTAVIFLVLLYNSPSGLVLYWTSSQVFSLCKNLVLETKLLKNHKFILPMCFLAIILASAGTAARVLATPAGMAVAEALVILAFIGIVRVAMELKHAEIPGAIKKLRKAWKLLPQARYSSFVIICLCCMLLYGFVIPSSVLSASAKEFVDTTSGVFQSDLLTYPATVYAGLFLVWCSVFYYFSGEKGRRILFTFVAVCLGVSLVNYFAFNVKPPFFYADLSFDGELNITRSAIVLNSLASLALALLLLWGWKINSGFTKDICMVVAVSLCLLGGYNTLRIPQALQDSSREHTEIEAQDNSALQGVLSLSREGKNIIVFMLDRALGSYVPFIFDEKPELAVAFDGFVFYPNTLSFGTGTSDGAPPLYGGYEYTPEAIIDREEQNTYTVKREALKVLPVLFDQHGFKTTVADPALFGVSLYGDYPDISALNFAGNLSSKYASLLKTDVLPIQKRNFVMYSFFMTSPLFLREKIYDNGGYLVIESSRTGYTQAFIDNYAVLDALPGLTSVHEDHNGSFLFLQNSTTHEPTILEAPDYAIAPGKNNYQIPYGERTINGRTLNIRYLDQWKHYCVNMAAYLELVEWIQTLKDYGVYDNTRIILAADHGPTLTPQFDDMVLPDGYDAEAVNPLLMVKDFNARGAMTTSMAFMTNADVPTLAVDGLIEDPVNPFTGKRITNEEKYSGSVMIPETVLRAKTAPEDKLAFDEYVWWSVKENIFDLNNWEKITPKEAEG